MGFQPFAVLYHCRVSYGSYISYLFSSYTSLIVAIATGDYAQRGACWAEEVQTRTSKEAGRNRHYLCWSDCSLREFRVVIFNSKEVARWDQEPAYEARGPDLFRSQAEKPTSRSIGEQGRSSQREHSSQRETGCFWKPSQLVSAEGCSEGQADRGPWCIERTGANSLGLDEEGAWILHQARELRDEKSGRLGASTQWKAEEA